MIFDGTDTSKVIQLETNSDPVQTDDKVNGKIHVYRFPNGSSSGIDTGGADAITVMSDGAIPADLRWNSALYTDDGQSASMTDLAFMIVKVDYDTNAGTTGLATMNVQLINSLNKPNEVLYDYMTNSRYGCALLPANIDTDSLDSLGVYSDELITYIPTTGGTATQPRYRINGPVNTGQNCLSNLQQLVDACDSWLQYSELTGAWTIVVNRPYNWDGAVITDLFLVDSSVLITGINVNPIDLNNSYNILEVQYPNTNILDQTDYNIINLVDYVPEVMSYNEPPNQLTVQFPQVNEYIQCTYLGIRRLLQSREDLTVDFTLDYSGIQIQAGDVIRIKFEAYGWDGLEFPDGKLFRVSQVQEAKLEESLGARITAFEYNGTVYYDDPLNDFVPASNTGLTDPNIFSSPGTPSLVTNPLSDGNVKSFKVTSSTSATGSVLYMDFNYGTSNNVTTHKLYRTISQADGTPYTASSSVSIDVTDLPPATYYWSVTARNQQAGRSSASSSSFVWGGPNVTDFDTTTGLGGISFTNLGSNTGGALEIALEDYSITSSGILGSPNPPINLTSYGTNIKTANFDRPKYLVGTTVSATKYYPFYQATSSTADGYYQNSAGVFTPSGANYMFIVNGDNNYWVLDYKPFNTILPSGQYVRFFYYVVLVSDIDATIQLQTFITTTSSATDIAARDDGKDTFYLKANQPQIAYIQSFNSAVGGTLDGVGVLLRNMTGSSTVTGTLASLTSYWQK